MAVKIERHKVWLVAKGFRQQLSTFCYISMTLYLPATIINFLKDIHTLGRDFEIKDQGP